jgi:hypothetical protein
MRRRCDTRSRERRWNLEEDASNTSGYLKSRGMGVSVPDLWHVGILKFQVLTSSKPTVQWQMMSLSGLSSYSCWYWKAITFDVETAFLYGKLDRKIYMDCPEGMEHEEDECVQLDRAMYGLVQASRVYYNTYSKII